MVRKLASRILDRQGYDVLVARSGGEAWMICEQHDEPIDLLLTDVIMPNMNGRELYEKLRQKHPGLKALFMSGYTHNVIAQRGVLEEDVNFLQKPFSVGALAQEVRAVLDGDRLRLTGH
jgi:CheY-like chemotaxis protein